MNRCFTAILVAAAIYVPSVAHADDFRDAVTACTAIVQADKQLEGADMFNAYVASPGHVKYLGSVEANFAFEKCLTEAGIDLDEEQSQ